MRVDYREYAQASRHSHSVVASPCAFLEYTGAHQVEIFTKMNYRENCLITSHLNYIQCFQSKKQDLLVTSFVLHILPLFTIIHSSTPDWCISCTFLWVFNTTLIKKQKKNNLEKENLDIRFFSLVRILGTWVLACKTSTSHNTWFLTLTH